MSTTSSVQDGDLESNLISMADKADQEGSLDFDRDSSSTSSSLDETEAVSFNRLPLELICVLHDSATLVGLEFTLSLVGRSKHGQFFRF